MLKVLKPIKLAVEALSRRNTNLLAADAIVFALCKELKSISSNLGKNMYQALHKRIDERRDKKLYTLFNFLKDPDFFNKSDDNKIFEYVTKYSVFGYAESMFERLFGSAGFEVEEVENEDVACLEENTFEQTLKVALVKASVSSKYIPKKTNKNSLKKELKLFEASGTQTQGIEILYNALLTIQPTSVESERVFSTTGTIVNKIRNRLSDETINALTVLKSYFFFSKYVIFYSILILILLLLFFFLMRFLSFLIYIIFLCYVFF